jgi:glycine betaine/proline transport system permease protein
MNTRVETAYSYRSTLVPAAVWATLFGASVLLAIYDQSLPWASQYPQSWMLPLAREITLLAKSIVANLSWLTRAISAVLVAPLDFSIALFAKGATIGAGDHAVTIPRLSWVGIIVAVMLLGRALGGNRTAAVGGVCFGYLALFGQWDRAMLTLASVAICVPIGAFAGLLVGILAYRSRRFDRFVVTPLLDLMQTVPAFAYIIPILFLFGFTPVTPMIATVAFAMPPMVRMTVLALRRVPEDIREFADMVGCTKGQKMTSVLLPSALPGLMVGVNQVIMMTLNMVIIASMVGADGLGFDVLFALRSQKIGEGLEAGLAITALAIALDRLSQAAASGRYNRRSGETWWRRNPEIALALAILAASTALSAFVPFLARVPEEMTVTTAPIWGEIVKWININFFDALEALRTTLLIYVLNPIKQSLLAAPWLGVVALVGFAGWRLGGWRLMVPTAAMIAMLAATGLWDKAMITVYLCGIATILSCLIGIPLGIWAAPRPRARQALSIVVDTLQTLPSFVYLIPVVMLFRVGDVTALIAIVAFAMAPAFRYTVHGILQVDPPLIEAARAMGCTRRQMLLRIQLPLALPEIMMGVNQTVLLALSMLVITALVGTRDLGQEVYIALTKVDTGRGIVAGVGVAFLGMTADRLVSALANRSRRRLGLTAADSTH